MDVTWFICMGWIFLHQYTNAMVNSSATLAQSEYRSTVAIAIKSSRAVNIPTTLQNYLMTQLVMFSRSKESVSSVLLINSSSAILIATSSIHSTKTETSTMQGNSRTKTKLSRNPESTPTVPTYVNVVTSSILSHSTYVPVVNETSTLPGNPRPKTKLSHSPEVTVPAYVNVVTSSTLGYSTYVPVVNGEKSNSDEIPLIILVPSSAGGGVLLILLIIFCCFIHRRLKRKRNKRIFQKYYRPTLQSNSSDDLEDHDRSSNVWASQMELKSENKDEQTIQSKPYQGISNRAFLPSEPLSEMDAIKALPSEIPVDMVSNDVSTSTNSNTMKDSSQEIKNSSQDDPVKNTRETNIDKVEDDRSLCDYQHASLLALEKLDHILNNECVVDDQNKEESGEYFVVIYPFQTSNIDEISLDVGSKVSVIDSKPSGWSWVLNEDGNTGWFPTQYLDHIDTEEAEDASENIEVDHQIGYSVPDQKRVQFAVLQSFSATGPDELSLAKYDIVTVTENSSSGWSWVNEPNVGSGWFPTNYLEPLVFPKKKTKPSSSKSPDYVDVLKEDRQYVYASSEQIQKVKKEGHYQEYEAKAYRASHAYTGSTEDELTFKQDETVLVLQETDTGWWRGSTYLGEGWFPSTFVEDPLNEDSSGTTHDSYEYVDPSEDEKCKKSPKPPSPYQVTELVSKKSSPSKQSARELVHQVPQAISKQEARNQKSKGKNLRPRRPAPPPPPCPSVSPTTPLQQLPSITPALSTSPLPPTTDTEKSRQEFAPCLLPKSCALESDIEPQSVPSFLTVPPPSPLPASPTSDVFQYPAALNAPTNIQENKDSIDSGNVEGIIIVPPRNKSGDDLSKLIKITKRRSTINPDPPKPPPNRPVPVPPPRKARHSPKSKNNHPRPRPTKMPRNLNNKNLEMSSIKDVPKDAPERPPPPIPEKLEEFLRKRRSSSTESANKLNRNKEHIPLKESPSHAAKNSVCEINGYNRDKTSDTCKEETGNIMENVSKPKPKQRHRQASNGEEDQQQLKEEKNRMASANADKVNPKPKSRSRSQEQFDSNNNTNSHVNPQSGTDVTKDTDRKTKEQDNSSDKGRKNGQETRVQTPQTSRKLSTDHSTPEEPIRSHSLTDEPSDDQPIKIRPKIKPRSKSLANVFSSTGEGNFERDETVNSQQPLNAHSSPKPIKKPNELQNSLSQSPPKPKPKTRVK